jgi:hypothetical protein
MSTRRKLPTSVKSRRMKAGTTPETPLVYTPTLGAIKRIAVGAAHPNVRGMWYPEEKFFVVWDANNALHNDVDRIIPYRKKLAIEIGPASTSISSEYMPGDPNAEQWMKDAHAYLSDLLNAENTGYERTNKVTLHTNYGHGVTIAHQSPVAKARGGNFAPEVSDEELVEKYNKMTRNLRGATLVINPDGAEDTAVTIRRLARLDEYGEVRGLYLQPSGRFLWWPASTGLHADLMQLSKEPGTAVHVSKTTTTVHSYINRYIDQPTLAKIKRGLGENDPDRIRDGQVFDVRSMLAVAYGVPVEDVRRTGHGIAPMSEMQRFRRGQYAAAPETEGVDLAADISDATVPPIVVQEDSDDDPVTRRRASGAVRVRRNPDRYKLGDKVGVTDIAEFLQLQQLDRIGRPLDIFDPTDQKQVIDMLTGDVRWQLKQIDTGVGWYDRTMDEFFYRAEAYLGHWTHTPTGWAMAPRMDLLSHKILMTAILGALSVGNKAHVNARDALDAMEMFYETGQVPTTQRGGRWDPKGWYSKEKGKTIYVEKGWPGQDAVEAGARMAFLNFLVQEKGVDGAAEFLVDEHLVRDLRNIRGKSGVWNVGGVSWHGVKDYASGSYVFGPKLGAFIRNLNGIDDVTVDVWATRSIGRLTGQLIGDLPSYDRDNNKMTRAPGSRKYWEAMKHIYTEVGKRTGLSARDAQAVAWYFEQQLYSDLGGVAEARSYLDGFQIWEQAGPALPRQEVTRGEGHARNVAARYSSRGRSAAEVGRSGIELDDVERLIPIVADEVARGERTIGRPDLANPVGDKDSRIIVDVVDALRESSRTVEEIAPAPQACEGGGLEQLRRRA